MQARPLLQKVKDYPLILTMHVNVRVMIQPLISQQTTP